MKKTLKINYSPFLILASCVLILSACAKEDTAPDVDKYLGDWVCKENPPSTFHINITKHGNEDSLDVSNFNNLGAGFKALFIVSGNSVVIPNQDVSGFSVSGSGTYNNNKMNLSYKVDSDNFTAECTK